MLKVERSVLKKFSDRRLQGSVRMESSLSEVFHENTKLTPLSSKAYGYAISSFTYSPAAMKLFSHPEKVYSLMDQVALGKVQPRDHLESSIAARRSVRSYTGEPMTMEEMSRLLYFSYGVTDPANGFRAVSSGGALFPLEIYTVPVNTAGLARGLYHYNIASHGLDVVSRDDLLPKLKESVWFQYIDVDQAAAIFVITMIAKRTTIKYQDRGYRMILFEAGEVAQNLTLLATSMGLGACLIGGFQDDQVSELIGIDGLAEAPLLILTVGRRPAGPGQVGAGGDW